MTRQKRELLSQIQQMERSIEIDVQLGFGYAPPGAFDRVYEEIYRLQEELAHLRHYASAEEMFCDTRGQVLDMELFTDQMQHTQMGLVVGRISFANGEQFDFTDPQEYIAAIREELPYHPTTGFRYETLTSDPEVRRAVDAELYDLYGMDAPGSADAEQQGMAMDGMSL